MMTFKKMLSLTMAAVLMLCTLSALFILPVSAFTHKERSLFLDFNDSKGIAGASAVKYFTDINGELDGMEQNGYELTLDPEEPSNTVLHMWNRVYNGYSVMLGTPGCEVSEDNAFTLMPSTTYTLTVRYKYEAGSSIVTYNTDKTDFTNTLRFELYSGAQADYSPSLPKTYLTALGRVSIDDMASKDILKASAKTNLDYDAETNNSVPQTYTRKMIAKDTEWMTAQYTFTTTADITNKEHLFFAISAGTSDISGGGWNQTDADQYIGLYLDDVTLECLSTAASEGEFIYDFKADGVSCYDGANQYWFSNCATDVYGTGEYGSYIADEGMYFTSTVGTAVNGTAQWRHRVALRDTDIDLGGDNGLLKIENGTDYIITVKYKPVNIEGPYSDFGIAVSAPGGNTYNSMTLGATQHMTAVIDWNRHENATDDWQYLTVNIDGDGQVLAGTDTAGSYVYLTANGSTAAPSTYLIEYIKVCVLTDASDCIVVKKNVRGNIIDASIMTEGEAISAPPKSLGETSTGWVMSDGTAVTAAPSASCTVYAAYPTNVYTFDNGLDDVYMPNTVDLGLKLEAVEDPLASATPNKVLKMNCTQDGGSTNNFVLSAVPGADYDGYKIKGGTSYTITMDVYLGENNMTGGNCYLGVWLVAKGGISHTGSKDTVNTDFSDGIQTNLYNSTADKNWVSIAVTYTPNATKAESYPYLAISFKYGLVSDSELDNAVLYFDNITITETESTENKGGSAALDAMGGKVSTSKLMCNAGEQLELPTPTKSGYVFAGWTQSKELALGTLANTQANMNDDTAPKTVVVAEKGTTYYAVWAAKTTEFTFGSENETTFQNNLTTTEVSESTVYVSVGFSLYDEDGDGGYELKADQTSRTTSSYKVNVGSYNGSGNEFYTLRNDVTYRITATFKVGALHPDADTATLAFGRCSKDGFAIVPLEGDDRYSYSLLYRATEVTDGYITVSAEYTVGGLFDTALNGSVGSGGGATTYKDCLFLSVGSGLIYVKNLKVEALSYKNVLTSVVGKGKIKIGYSDNTVTAIPDTGYVLRPGSIKMTYRYHFYDYATLGSYDPNNAEHVASLSEAVGYSQTLFNIVSSDFGNDTYSFVNRFGTCPDGMVFTAEFIPENEVSTGIVASSIRTEKATEDEYRSAGIRFRGRVLNDERIVEVGFIAVPTELMKSFETLTFAPDGTLNCANALSVAAFTDGKNTVYEKTERYTDYQMIITGLTHKDQKYDMTDVDFSVVIYAKYDNDGSYEYSYSDIGNNSWVSVYSRYDDSVRSALQ